MLSDVMGSDHCPVQLDIDMDPSACATARPAPAYRGTPYDYEKLIALDSDRRRSALRYADRTLLWRTIDWQRAEKHLADMQEALARSVLRGSVPQIEKWQKRIAYDLDARVLAVRHVCASGAIAGVDQVRWDTDAEKMEAALSLTPHGYKAYPARLVMIETKGGRHRRVNVLTMHDKTMQVLYSYTLAPVAETRGDLLSFSARKGRSTADLCEVICQIFTGADAPRWAVVADVHRCYDHINHEWVLENIPMQKYVLRQFLEAGYITGG